MIKRINKNAIQGQTALIMILLTAAALIFLAITMNWGRVAQVKSLVTMAADEGATTLASDAASYGEMLKQTDLQDTNQKSGLNGTILAIAAIIVAVLVIVFPPVGVAAGTLAAGTLATLSVISLGMAILNLVLELAVLSPMITAQWNKLQANQPVQQQFFEGGITTALSGSVGDQVNITDYFDLNTNGRYGNTNGFPNDTISRFAFFYTDRLKMLNQQDIPQVVLFYNQLGEVMNGETCGENASDNTTNPLAFPINPACNALDCTDNPTDPACQMKIPDGFQLNDACPASSDPTNSTYNPYCDPCCQPVNVPDPDYNASNPMHSSPNISVRPANCPADITTECQTNNPYGPAYLYLYDPTYQNYANGISFLAQFGRDQQMGPFTTLTPQGSSANGIFFPNGVYPFFWLMKDYNPQVNNIDPTTLKANSPDLHWCAAATVAANGINIPPAAAAPTGFSDLAQLSLPYACQGQDCCVNYFAKGVTNGVPSGVNANIVIDTVGKAPSPVLDPNFGEGGAGSWLQGDNQFCSSTLPYNAADANSSDGTPSDTPDGACEWTGSATAPTSSTPQANSTVDSVDDTMHTLSDFVNFANTLLNKDIDTLNSAFDSWYPQAAGWIAPACGGSIPSPACNDPCDDGTQCSNGQCTDGTSCGSSDGRLLSIYDPYVNVADPVTGATGPFDKLKYWDEIITNWLAQTYTSPVGTTSPWCVPPSTDPSLNVSNTPTVENNYIASNGAANDAKITASNPKFISTWGDLGYVTACLDYNAGQNSNGTPATSLGPVYNYQQCLNALPTTGACPATLPAACEPLTLGRSLAGTAPSYPGSSCDITQAGSYGKWVSDSLTLATDEAPKFALRANFLNDVYTRAQTMQTIFQQGDIALAGQTVKNVFYPGFLSPCSGTDCSDGGAAAQLMYERSQPQPITTLPNAVIYGWVDNPLPSGQPGYAHIVKVTAYSPGRGGNANSASILSLLPWIKTHSSVFKRYYTLLDRDGYVYVSVKRWDEDHSNALIFPNGHPLWQFSFHNPKTPISDVTRQQLMQACQGLEDQIGFGLGAQTIKRLESTGISAQDITALDNAFMLDDEGNGKIDPSATKSSYKTCLSDANRLLDTAPESHACVQYIASSNASKASGTNDHDYSLKFVDCNSVPGPLPDDLTYEGS